MLRFLLVFSLVSAAQIAASEAQACGGTFCDSTPTSMPVDQTGETILFVVDGDFVEAHVQIQYDGKDATKFAWIVPVPEIPEVEVGSQALIDAVRDATVPVFGYTQQNTCTDPAGGSGGPAPSGFITMSDGGAGGSGPQGPTVVTTDSVGAFDYAVLAGGTIEGLTTWLTDNAYATDEAAVPILGEYLDEGAVFVAFKLDHRAGVEDIHPVVIRYPGAEACIPIRLTRIAAEDDMPIRALFLGDDRVMPLDYRHVRINSTRLNWPAFADNYDEVVSLAVDEAGGRAFVTEYAGPSDVIDPTRIPVQPFDPAMFDGLDPIEALDHLYATGLLGCGDDTCSYAHPTLRTLLSRYLPVPDGLTDVQFYGCPICYAAQIDMTAWDPVGFTTDFVAWIVAPARHARELVETWPYLTRLYTRISPHEMLGDPRFAEVVVLEDVPNRRGAQATTMCCGTIARLPGGRLISVTGGWPVWGDTMPWAERIEEVDPQGHVLTLDDRTAAIDERIDSYNAGRPCSTAPADTTGEGGDDTSSWGPTTSGAPSEHGGGETSACTCHGGARPGPWLTLGVLLLVAPMRRRR